MLIRYTYPADIARYGEFPREVPDVVAKVLVNQKRRAVLVDPAELPTPEPVVQVEPEDQ